jgi:hypothetical protein
MSQLKKGDWSSPKAINGEIWNPASPRIAMDNNGNAIIAWQMWQIPTGIAILEYHDGKWSDPKLFNMTGETTTGVPSVAMNSHGKSIVVWEQGRNIYKVESQNGKWGDPEKISNLDYCRYPEVKMFENGQSIIIWLYDTGSYRQRKIYSREYINGNWNDQKIISLDGNDPGWLRIASDNKGNAIVVWTQLEGTTFRGYMNEFRSNRWATPSACTPSNVVLDSLSIAMSKNGNAVLAWQQMVNYISQVYTTEYINGIWSDPTLRSQEGVKSVRPLVTMDNKGNTILLWNQEAYRGYEVYMKEYRHNNWGNKVLLALSDNILNPVVYASSMNNKGDAIIVWEQAIGENWQLYRRQYH